MKTLFPVLSSTVAVVCLTLPAFGDNATRTDDTSANNNPTRSQPVRDASNPAREGPNTAVTTGRTSSPWFEPNKDNVPVGSTVGQTSVNRVERLGATEKSSKVIGWEVRNTRNEKLGKIEDLAIDMDTGRIVSVIVGSGGFLGIGERYFAIPPTALSYDAAQEVVLLNMDKERFKAAPAFELSRWDEYTTADRLAESYRYYGQPAYWTSSSSIQSRTIPSSPATGVGSSPSATTSGTISGTTSGTTRSTDQNQPPSGQGGTSSTTGTTSGTTSGSSTDDRSDRSSSTSAPDQTTAPDRATSSSADRSTTTTTTTDSTSSTSDVTRPNDTTTTTSSSENNAATRSTTDATSRTSDPNQQQTSSSSLNTTDQSRSTSGLGSTSAGSTSGTTSARSGSSDLGTSSSSTWSTGSYSQLGHVDRAKKIVGMPVQNMQQERVGKVDNLIVDLAAGRIVSVIVSSGGFLGMGDTLSAVPPQAFRTAANRDALLLDVSKEKLASYPHFTGNQWPQFNDPNYVSGVYRSYNVNPYFTSTPAADVDNTRQNIRDRNDQTLTPLDQGNNAADVQTTARIRRAITSESGFSTNARNIKIITANGQTTLRGVVDSDAERKRIEELARQAMPNITIDNQLEVQAETSRNR
jgi:sporulation protein YlmC with PRC-barrel domain